VSVVAVVVATTGYVVGADWIGTVVAETGDEADYPSALKTTTVAMIGSLRALPVKVLSEVIDTPVHSRVPPT